MRTYPWMYPSMTRHKTFKNRFSIFCHKIFLTYKILQQYFIKPKLPLGVVIR